MASTTQSVPETAPIAAKLDLVVQEQGFAIESARPILEPFTQFLAQAEEWRIKVSGISVTDVSQVREMKLARESRLALRDIRIGADKARKRLKDESLRRSRMIDGAYAVVEGLVAPLEDALLRQEQFAERKEAERKAKLKADREELLRPYGADTAFYSLGDMPDETFADLLVGTRKAFEERKQAQAKIEADRIAAEKAERERQEQIRAENERLKAEKAQQERLLADERARAAAAVREAEAKVRAERDAVEAARRKEQQAALDAQERAKRENEAKLKAEREIAAAKQAEAEKARQDAERAKIAAEEQLRAVKQAEERKAREQAEAARKAALAPDRDKLLAMAGQIRAIQVPEMLSAEGISAQIDVLDWIEQLAERVEKLAARF